MPTGRRLSAKLGAAGGVAGLERKHAARAGEPDSARDTLIVGAGGLSTGRGMGSARGDGRVRGGLFNDGGENNPAARHEEARMRFEQDVATKLRRVIEKKKMENLKVRTTRWSLRIWISGVQGETRCAARCFFETVCTY